MKISYIILPDENNEHLVRCINSIYRQTDAEYYVILADNADNVFLSDRPLIKLSDNAATREEKIKRALSLVPDDSEYIIFTDRSTVVAPITARSLQQNEGADVIVLAASKKINEEFEPDRPALSDVIKNVEKYAPSRFCFNKKCFEGISPEILSGGAGFDMLLLRLALNGKIAISDEICLYIENTWTPEKKVAHAAFSENSAERIADSLCACDNAEIKAAVLDKLTGNILSLYFVDDKKHREDAFRLLKRLCAKIADNVFLSKLFESAVGCECGVFSNLSADEYDVYMQKYQDPKKAQTTVAVVQNDTLIKQISSDVKAFNDRVAAMQKEINAMSRQYISSVSKAESAPRYSDPVNEIPNLFAQGRLGFKVIWHSLGAWFRYKLRRKK